MRIAYLVLALGLGFLPGATRLSAQEPGRVAGMCADCHGGEADGKLDALNHGNVGTCLACHHIGFTNDSATAVARRLDACVGCHEEIQPSHFGATGEDAPACTTCHTIHGDTDPAAVQRAVSATCSTCHTTKHVLHGMTPGAEAPLCTQCHINHAAHAPPGPMADSEVSGRCADCHGGVHPEHALVPGGFTCTECHSVEPPPEPVTVEDRSATCNECHSDVIPTHASVTDGAPTCLQCHDFEKNRMFDEAAHAGSTRTCSQCHSNGALTTVVESGVAMSAQCAECHEDEWNALRSGGHRDALADVPNADLPNCLTCHSSHVGADDTRGHTRLAATAQCIACHSRPDLIEKYGLPADVGASYTNDYHGETMQFLLNQAGGGDEASVLVCADCHGAHKVGWDEKAAVGLVCTKCHDKGDAKLAGAWLGHDPVGPRNKAMVWFVRLFYYGLIPFMLGGLFLNIAFDLAERRREGARVMKTTGVKYLMAWLRRKPLPDLETVTRFSVTERLEHFGSMVTFMMLVVTGLPQTRPDLPIANWIIGLFGGIASTRIVHRVFGFLFVTLMLTHVTRAIVKALRTRHMPVMVANQKDFADLRQTARHFLFRAPRPKSGKFDLASKFEYWGLFLGGIIMSVTGIFLVFPVLVTHLLPGQILAATRVMHGLEATFAVLVVALWHSYGVILRPEIFPLDTSIFTGKMSVERLREEHPLEYKRLFPDRPLDEEPDEEAPGIVGPGSLEPAPSE